MKLLDTTFLIHYWGGVDAVAEYLDAHEEEDFITTTLNLNEIAVGRALQDSFDPHEIQSTFDWVETVPFERAHAFEAGRLEAALRRDDLNQDKINALASDILIAAVASERKATVVTENAADFERFDGISVETYLDG